MRNAGACRDNRLLTLFMADKIANCKQNKMLIRKKVPTPTLIADTEALTFTH